MYSSRWTGDQLKGFHAAAQSLKLYRRAELQDDAEGASLIEALYVDPLPHEHILQTMIKANTTFLIGRKGTGKSTVFQRARHELHRKPSYASAYVDIKTIFESSQVDSSLLTKVDAPDALSGHALEKLLLYRAFLREVITEIKDEIRNKVVISRWERLKRKVSGSQEELFEGLDSLLEEADDDKFISVLGVKRSAVQSRSESSQEAGVEATTSASIGPTASVKGSITAREGSAMTVGEDQQYADLLMRVFDIKEFISRLKTLLTTISVKHLYIFVDDFSELPEEAMKIVVDTGLAPLR